MNRKTDFLLPAMLLLSSNAYALDWLFEPDFSFKERYEDNLRMQINPTRSNLISTLSPGLMLGYLADDNELRTNFKWNELIYHGQSELDFSEKLADISHRYQAERFKTDLAAQYAEQSSINTQLDLTGSGDIQTQVARTTRSIAPTVTYNLTERNALQFGYNYVDVAFDRKGNLQNNLSYSDYSNQQYSATAIHTYSPRLSFNLSGSYSAFDSGSDSVSTLNFPNFTRVGNYLVAPGSYQTTSTFSQKSTTFNYQAGLQYAFSEQMQLSLSAGIRNTETQSSFVRKFSGTDIEIANSSQSSSKSGHVFSASLNRISEWGSFSLSAGQQLNPASTGSQQQSTTFSAGAKYNLSERWAAGINASYLMTESASTVNNNNVSNNRTYATLSPNIRWRWTPEINLDLSYTHRQQEYQSIGQTAIGNSVQLQFSYQPQINRQVK
jgi:hypothetical protein